MRRQGNLIRQSPPVFFALGYGETISTAFAESTINQVVSKRMVKKQQMRWSQKGAHLLLQVRTRVLNGELRDEFRKWYQGFGQGGEELPLAA